MTHIVHESLKKMAVGTSIVLIGTIVSMFFEFLSRILIIRSTSTAEYGIFALALVILNIAVIAATLGLQNGATRQIAYYRGRGDLSRVYSTVVTSLELTAVAGIVCGIVMYAAAGLLADVLSMPQLGSVVRIFAIGVPFFAATRMLMAVYRGFDSVKERVYFNDLMQFSLRIVLLAVVVYLGLSFGWVLFAYLVPIVVTGILFAGYTLRRFPAAKASFVPVRWELLVLSLPLLINGVLNLFMTWTDTLMLGYYKTAEIVGLYNGAVPVAQMISVILMSTTFMYVPIISKLYSKGKMVEMRRSYAVLTKWVFSATLPGFFLVFLFPSAVLTVLFGAEYSASAAALQILALGFFVHTFLGPNGMTMIALGKTRILMWFSGISVIVNVVLNVLLIPQFGMAGAAVASVATLTAANVLTSLKIYQYSGIHPFTWNYIKPVAVAVVLCGGFYYVTGGMVVASIFRLLALFVLFVVVYMVSLVLTRSIDREDAEMLIQVEKRCGVNLTPLKKLIGKFM